MLRGLKIKAKAQGNINLRQSAWKDTKVGRLHMLACTVLSKLFVPMQRSTVGPEGRSNHS